MLLRSLRIQENMYAKFLFVALVGVASAQVDMTTTTSLPTTTQNPWDCGYRVQQCITQWAEVTKGRQENTDNLYGYRNCLDQLKNLPCDYNENKLRTDLIFELTGRLNNFGQGLPIGDNDDVATTTPYATLAPYDCGNEIADCEERFSKPVHTYLFYINYKNCVDMIHKMSCNPTEYGRINDMLAYIGETLDFFGSADDNDNEYNGSQVVCGSVVVLITSLVTLLFTQH